MSEAINMHKRLAMGEKLTGQKLKHGPMPNKKKDESPNLRPYEKEAVKRK
jgi:hypothetical protein